MCSLCSDLYRPQMSAEWLTQHQDLEFVFAFFYTMNKAFIFKIMKLIYLISNSFSYMVFNFCCNHRSPRQNQVILAMQAYKTYSLSFWKCICYLYMLIFEHRERLSMTFLAKITQRNTPMPKYNIMP